MNSDMVKIGSLRRSARMSIVIGLSMLFGVCSQTYAQGQGPGRIQSTDALDDYLIGSGDVLDIQVWRNEALSRVEVVRPDGRISLPLMGELKATGLTALALRDKIIEELKKLGETPEATVIVREINSFVIYVDGEVQRPGRFQLNRRTTLVQAISMAGGLTSFASSKKVTLMRKLEGTDKELRIIVDYDSVISGESRNIWLQAGDTIVVP
jgi:polysaccharide export outer membrane protein